MGCFVRRRRSSNTAQLIGVLGILLCSAAFAPVGRAAAAARYAPPVRYAPGMAFDAARGQTVLFGGSNYRNGPHNDTWTWDGTAWKKQHPAHVPAPRSAMGMAYDAARGQVVLFGGTGGGNSTWTWDGVDWTRHYPRHAPPSLSEVGMAYDAAHQVVVLFGGNGTNGTWTWDGKDWTQRFPVTSPPPRFAGSLAYDSALGQVVLFGGVGPPPWGTYMNDTWTWNGTNWKEQHPLSRPSPRGYMGMTYDSARARVVVFGGCCAGGYFNDTWTWDGTNWKQQHPSRSPSKRVGVGMSYDEIRGRAVLFGGHEECCTNDLGDTWTWDGAHWSVPFVPGLRVRPASGPPGEQVHLSLTGFAGDEPVTVTFVDAVHGPTVLGTFRTRGGGNLRVAVTIPGDASVGTQTVTADGATSGQHASATFTVT